MAPAPTPSFSAATAPWTTSTISRSAWTSFFNEGFYGLTWGQGFSWFSTGNVWVEQKEDGQHVFVDYKDSAIADLEIVVQTTDGELLTHDDFLN